MCMRAYIARNLEDNIRDEEYRQYRIVIVALQPEVRVEPGEFRIALSRMAVSARTRY